jgi:hypothetical protein
VAKFLYCTRSVKEYPDTVRGRSDALLRQHLRAYSGTGEGSGSSRRFLYERADHREWRRLVIREALRRGLIDKDPLDAP